MFLRKGHYRKSHRSAIPSPIPEYPIINGRTELLALLEGTSGGTYQLADGDYGDIDTSVDYTTPLTLIGGRGATFGEIDIYGSKLTIQGIDAGYINIQDAQDITVNNCEVHGTDYLVVILDTTHTTTNITLYGCEFHHAGIDLVRVVAGTGNQPGFIDGVTIENCFFHDTGLSGISHPDAIQTWMYARNYDGSPYMGPCGVANYTIKGNIVLGEEYGPQMFFINSEGLLHEQIIEETHAATITYVDGSGSWSPVSGTFAFTNYAYDNGFYHVKITGSASSFSNLAVCDRVRVTATVNNNLDFVVMEVAGDGSWFYANRYNLYHGPITIENNFLVGNSPNGFSVTYAKNLTVQNNLLIGLPYDCPQQFSTALIVQGLCRDVSISGNVVDAEEVLGEDCLGTLTAGDLYSRNSVNDTGFAGRLFVDGLRRYSQTTDAWQVPSTSPIYSHPAVQHYRSILPPQTWYITVTQTSGTSSLSVAFGISSISAGTTPPGGTTYSWVFGDGDTSSSATPIHVYTTPGEYEVTCSINGGTAIKRIVNVISSLIASLTLQSDLSDLGYDTPTWETYGSLSFPNPTINDTNGFYTNSGQCRITGGLPELTISIDNYQASEGGGKIFHNAGIATLEVNPTNVKWQVFAGGGTTITAGGTFNDSTWRKITAVYSSVLGKQRLYIDNVLVGEENVSGALESSTYPTYFGYWNPGKIRNICIIAGVPEIVSDAAKDAINAFIAANVASGPPTVIPDDTVGIVSNVVYNYDATQGDETLDPSWIEITPIGSAGVQADGTLVLWSTSSWSFDYRMRMLDNRRTNWATLTVTVS